MSRTRPAGVIAPLACSLVVLAALAGTAPSSLAQSFTLVGTLPEGGSSVVNGLSDDGRSAAGWLNTIQHSNTGFLWNASNGRNDFGLTASPTRGFGISGNGQYVVGGSSSGAFAFRWSEAGGYQNLGTIAPFPNSKATDASYDGSVVVGTLDSGIGNSVGFRWTQATGMQTIPLGAARAISGDGNVIVGEQGTAPFAYRWTQANGLQALSPLGGTGGSYAFSTNFNGNIVVGLSGTTLHTTMWTDGAPTELMSSLSGFHTFVPYGVSNDASVVVGETNGGTAAVWTAGTGSIPLATYLVSNGVTLPPGILLESCTAVSADGKTFAGYTRSGGGVGNIGFVASIHRNCIADLDDGSGTGGRDHAVTIDDLLYFLAAFEAGSAAADLDNGTGTGTRDNAVTIEDLLFFLPHFEAGC